MAKTTAPALAFGASGQIAKTLVYGKWKGRAYARRHVVPANPQTTAQMQTRNAFSFLSNLYKVAPVAVTDTWKAYAVGKVLTDRNAFTKFNLPLINGASDLSTFTMSPGSLGGPAPVSATPAGSGADVDVTVVPPDPAPTDWTIARAWAAGILPQDPYSPTDLTIVTASDATDPYVCKLLGVEGVDQEVFAWLEWLRPDGKTAYSPSIQTTWST